MTPPEANLPRYAREREFPPYRYRPGRSPHPTRDPRGHSHARAPHDVAEFTVDSGRDHADFRFGVDLYNHGFFWEAHEAFEDLWRESPARSRERSLLQGLIQAAAAQLKDELGDARGARRLLQLASEKLARVAPRCASIDVDAFVARLTADLVDSGPFAVLRLDA